MSDEKLMSDQNAELSDRELDEIRHRCEAASPGPWRSFVEGRDHTSGSSFIMTGTDENRGNDIELCGATSADQDFIANARQDVPRLINELLRFKETPTNLRRERERLDQEIQRILNEHRQLEEKLATIDRELRGIEAYEAARIDQTKPPAVKERRKPKRRGGSSKRREDLLRILQQHSAGLTRGEILEKMDLKRDKAGEMSVANGLTALARAGRVARDRAKK